MDINEIYPIRLEKKLRQQAGDLFDEIKAVSYDEELLRARLKHILTSPEYNLYYDTVAEKQIDNTMMRYQNVFAWNKTKQVYRFDNDLWTTIQSVEKVEIHYAVFKLLPFPTFWIDHEFERGFAGCMINSLESEIWFTFLKDDVTSYLKIHIPTDENDGKTVEGLLQEYDVPDWFLRNLRAALNAVIYLCTVEPDVSTTKIELPRATAPKKSTKKSKKNTLKIGNVGAKAGRIIREYEERERHATTGAGGAGRKGTAKSPHIRRAHYHSFWTGTAGAKQLIVKFLSPIFIHGESEDIKPTVRQREKKRKNHKS